RGHALAGGQGCRPTLPFELTPARGFIATANNNINPPGYTPPLMFKNADTRFERMTRLLQLLSHPGTFSLEDHRRMQHDAYSLRAAADLAVFKGWSSTDADVERARGMVGGWDAVYRKDSQAAAVYEAWRGSPGRGAGGGRARAEAPVRDAVEARLRAAVDRLVRDQGRDWGTWRWGRLHTRTFTHPFFRDFDLPA